MHLLGDVHLIENEILATPTISTNECSSDSNEPKLASLNPLIMETIIYASMIGSHCW